MATLKKYKIILEELNKKRKLTAYDEDLKEKLNLTPKQIGRILEELRNEFDNIQLEKSKKKTYKLVKKIDIFLEGLNNYQEIGWLFNMAHEGDPELFKELEQFTKKDKHIYKFKNTPFEDISTLEQKDIFKKLKRAVKYREYLKITDYNNETYDNLKALKLLFIDNNWYLAYVNEENQLKLARITFIKRVDYASKIGSFQKNSVQKHLDFLENNLQNSMTLFGVTPKVAKIKANPNIAKYFKKGMKKFLSSQKFEKELKDGSVIFSVTYTQELEVLPFIQRWLPDLIILSPEELKTTYKEKLKKMIEYLDN